MYILQEIKERFHVGLIAIICGDVVFGIVIENMLIYLKNIEGGGEKKLQESECLMGKFRDEEVELLR